MRLCVILAVLIAIIFNVYAINYTFLKSKAIETLHMFITHPSSVI